MYLNPLPFLIIWEKHIQKEEGLSWDKWYNDINSIKAENMYMQEWKEEQNYAKRDEKS